MTNTMVADYMLDFSGGQNASIDPAVLPANNYSSSVNTTNQNGILGPRWGFKTIDLDFSDTPDLPGAYGRTIKAEKLFKAGRFQSFIPYSVGIDYFILITIAGYIFCINQNTWKVTVLNPTDPLDVNAARLNWSPAGRFGVIFDYPSVPIILEGLIARRSDPTKDEVPVSVIGGYNQNMLMIGNAGNEFAFSDPAAYGFPDGPITFTLINQPSTGYTGQVFQLSTNYGNAPISAMGFLQMSDTNTGIGPALISTKDQVFSYLTQNPRANWVNNQFGSALLGNTGIAGQRSQVNINSDLLFVSIDGQVRALSMSRDQQKRWGNFPISIEVSNYLILRDKELAQYTPVGYFKNKCFFGANPFRTDGIDSFGNVYTDYAFGGFVVMELNSVSGLGSSAGAVPTWAGLWTGLRPMDILVNNEECFVISKDEIGGNTLYKMDPSVTYDTIHGKERQVRSLFYTRAFNGQNSPLTNKLLHSLRTIFTNIEGKFSLEVSYKPEHAPNYTPWRTYSYEAPVQECSSFIQNPNGLAGHSIRDFYLGGVPDEFICNDATHETYSTFKKVQLLFEIIGRNWNLTSFQVNSILSPQTPNEVLCEEFTPTFLPLKCLKDWEIYDPATNCN